MEKSSFFNAEIINGNPDRQYLAEDFAKYFSVFIGSGVFIEPSSNLQVMANNNMNVTLMQGEAWINGYFYQNTSNFNLAITPADGVLDRIDRIVIRLDFLNREIKCYVKEGEFSSTPMAKDIIRNTDMYEIALADIKVNNGAIKITQADILDLRQNSNYCGVVHGTVEQVDPTTLFNQYSAALELKEKGFEDEFYNWFNNIKGQLDGDIATNLANQISEINLNLDDKLNKKIIREKVNYIADVKNGFYDINKLNGRTLYKLKDGTYTDVFPEDSTEIDCLESTGEIDGKIGIKSIGKNLLSYEDFLSNEGNKLTFKNLTNCSFTASSWAGNSIGRNLIEKKLKPNIHYVMRFKCTQLTKSKLPLFESRVGFYFYAYGKYPAFSIGTTDKLKGVGDTQEVVCTFVTPPNINELDLWEICMYTNRYEDNNGNVEKDIVLFEDIQIEEGTQFTEYESYKEDKIEILIPNSNSEPLRGLTDEICDEIDSDGNIIRKTGELILNGSESWSARGVNGDFIGLKIQLTGVKSSVSLQLEKCNNFKCFENDAYNITGKGFIIGKEMNGVNVAFFTIDKASLVPYGLIEADINTHVSSFEEWLKNNITIIIYELLEPIKEKIEAIPHLASFEKGTLYLENEVAPIVNLDYAFTIGGTVTSILSKLDENEKEIQDIKDEIQTIKENPAHWLKYNINIIPEGWLWDNETGYYKYTYTSNDIRAIDRVDLTINLETLHYSSKLMPVTQTFDGYVLFFAKERLYNVIVADMAIFRGGV
ncbi:MAG: hypothetical protein ACRCW0_01900 [Clostridium sp.]